MAHHTTQPLNTDRTADVKYRPNGVIWHNIYYVGDKKPVVFGDSYIWQKLNVFRIVHNSH